MRVIAYMPVAKLSANLARRPAGGFAAESVLVRLRGMVAPRLHDGDNLVGLGSLNLYPAGFLSATAPSCQDAVVAGGTQAGSPALVSTSTVPAKPPDRPSALVAFASRRDDAQHSPT